MEEVRAGSALFEHRFWLQILGDHSRMILNSLSPKETEDIRKAQTFVGTFDALLAQARNASEGADLTALNREAYAQAGALRAFKLDLLARHLFGRANNMLTPTFLNHMVNELEEYLRILQALIAGRPAPEFDTLHHDFLWLPDAAGHAGVIAADLDMVEKRLIRKSKHFMKHFEGFYLKAIEMAGYLRTNVRDFPAFRRFHRDVDLEIRLFVAFLSELEEAELSAEVLDRISPLIPDHMMREEWYYITKLAASGLSAAPQGDPTKPRVQG
ncbi:DUF2935 domain-containing protein [Cohnella caldifontis]|uniref:DUF2935 domain-containing protein n=1 Tax=Cohnella caldifontis TaxID=3027471 RepID=UPI0023EC69EE|nr:DUF2935 domain-containing protein [Cohnella sp. YIM B05605]